MKLETVALYRETFDAAARCFHDRAFVAGTILCFGLHEALAAAIFAPRKNPRRRFTRFSVERLDQSELIARRLWDARNGVVHAFGRDGDVKLLEADEDTQLPHLGLDTTTNELCLRPTVYLQQLKHVFEADETQRAIAKAEQFLGQQPTSSPLFARWICRVLGAVRRRRRSSWARRDPSSGRQLPITIETRPFPTTREPASFLPPLVRQLPKRVIVGSCCPRATGSGGALFLPR